MCAQLTGDADSARDEPRRREIARVAADQHEPATHAVGEPRARVTVNRQRAARHAFHVAGERARREIAAIARNREPSATHFAGGEMAGVTVDPQHAAGHLQATLIAYRTADDEVALRHSRADAVEPRYGVFDHQGAVGAALVRFVRRRRIAAARDVEYIADGATVVACGQHDALDVRDRERRERRRQQRRGVDAKTRRRPDAQRSHDTHAPLPPRPAASW